MRYINLLLTLTLTLTNVIIAWMYNSTDMVIN